MRFQIITAAVSEDFEHLAGPGNDIIIDTHMIIMHGRFIGIKARQGIAKAFPDCLFILFMGQIKKFACRFRIERIYIIISLLFQKIEKFPFTRGGFPGNDSIK